MVLTGVDRPLGEGMPLTFFGRRAVLPVGHVRLAQETGAALVFAASRVLDEGRYLAFGGEVLLPDDGASKDGLRVLAQRVVASMEAVISERPTEWLMFFPVWDGSA
jgi:KDO2-lipid IV(A) lauroyltransferase